MPDHGGQRGNSRVGVSIGTVRACTCGTLSFSATCGAASVFWWARIAFGDVLRNSPLSSSVPPVRPRKHLVPKRGPLALGRRQERLEVGADRREADPIPGSERLEAGVHRQRHAVAARGESSGQGRKGLDVPGTPGAEHHDLRHAGDGLRAPHPVELH